jgi:hypothetical protein
MTPGMIVGNYASQGTLALLLRQASTSGNGAIGLVSAAHVLSFFQIRNSGCAASPDPAKSNHVTGYSRFTLDGITGVDFGLGPADPTDLGPVVWQTCMGDNNTADSSIARLNLPNGVEPDVQANRFTDPASGIEYFMEPPQTLFWDAVAARSPVIRFGARTGIATGNFVNPVLPFDLPVEGVSIPLTYANLAWYTSNPSTQPGDSGALVALALTPNGSGPIPVAPIGIHVGGDDQGNSYCYPLQPILDLGWEIIYDSVPAVKS